MGQRCLTKLVDNVTVDCNVRPVGVKNLYLMHSDEVTLLIGAGGFITLATFSASGKAYLVEGYKQNLQITSSVESTDASRKLAISVTFKIPTVSAALMRAFLGGSFYVLVERNDGTYFLVGVQAPLACSAFDFDSNSNAGMATVTLTHPEGSAGNFFMSPDPSVVTTIKSKVGG